MLFGVEWGVFFLPQKFNCKQKDLSVMVTSNTGLPVTILSYIHFVVCGRKKNKTKTWEKVGGKVIKKGEKRKSLLNDPKPHLLSHNYGAMLLRNYPTVAFTLYNLKSNRSGETSTVELSTGWDEPITSGCWV